MYSVNRSKGHAGGLKEEFWICFGAHYDREEESIKQGADGHYSWFKYLASKEGGVVYLVSSLQPQKKICFNQTVILNIKLKASCNLLTHQEIRVELEPNFKDKEKAMWTINVI